MPDTANATPLHKRKRSRATSDLIELQRLLMDDARNCEVPASVRAQVARAWSDLQDMRLRMAMKPAPKPVEVGLRKPSHSQGNFASASVAKAA